MRNLATRSDSVAIVRSVAALAKSLDMETVAEGVETHDELALIESAGCTHVQGYLFSRPVGPDAIAQLYKACARVLDVAA